MRFLAIIFHVSWQLLHATVCSKYYALYFFLHKDHIVNFQDLAMAIEKTELSPYVIMLISKILVMLTHLFLKKIHVY